MGFAISWLAVRGKAPSVVRRELELQSTGEPEWDPECPVAGAELPGGWYLVFSNEMSYIDDLPFDRLSTGAEVVVCYLWENVATSGAEGWKDGRKMWSVRCDVVKEKVQLNTEGELPEELGPIRDQLSVEQGKKQENINLMFNVPVELVEKLTGFHPTSNTPGGEGENGPYDRLQPIAGGVSDLSPPRGCVGALFL